jgi:hypothetical protein
VRCAWWAIAGTEGGEHEQQVFFFIDISCAPLNPYVAAADAAPTSMVLASGFCPSLPQPRPDHDPRARLDLVHLQAWLGVQPSMPKGRQSSGEKCLTGAGFSAFGHGEIHGNRRRCWRITRSGGYKCCVLFRTSWRGHSKATR